MRRRNLVIIPVVALAVMVVFGWPKSQKAELPRPPASVQAGVFLDHDPVFSSLRAEEESARVSPPVGDECSASRPPIDHDAFAEERNAHLAGATVELANSNNAEHLLAAAILSQLESAEAPFPLFDRAAKIDPGNRLITWIQLQLCRQGKREDCDFERVVANAKRVDDSNGALWMDVATQHLEVGDENAAAEAVRRAIAAPRFDTYFIDYVILIERALSTHGESSYADRVAAGFGFAAAMAIPAYSITRHCAASGSADTNWIDLCDQLGAKMYAADTTAIGRAIGVALQRIAAEQDGDPVEIARATTRESDIRQERQKFIASREAIALQENDESVLRRYVENFSIYGEIEAQSRLLADVERLKNSPDYDQCNFVSRGVIN